MGRLADNDRFDDRDSVAVARELEELFERWSDVLDSGRPAYITAYAHLIVEQLHGAESAPLVARVLWQALDAVGPGPEAAAQRAALGPWLFDVAMRTHDLPLAFNVAARMVLADGPHDEFWYRLHTVFGVMAESDQALVVQVFRMLEDMFDSGQGQWDAVDGALGDPFSSGN